MVRSLQEILKSEMLSKCLSRNVSRGIEECWGGGEYLSLCECADKKLSWQQSLGRMWGLYCLSFILCFIFLFICLFLCFTYLLAYMFPLWELSLASLVKKYTCYVIIYLTLVCFCCRYLWFNPIWACNNVIPRYPNESIYLQICDICTPIIFDLWIE